MFHESTQSDKVGALFYQWSTKKWTLYKLTNGFLILLSDCVLRLCITVWSHSVEERGSSPLSRSTDWRWGVVSQACRLHSPKNVIYKDFCIYLETGHRKDWPLCSDWRRSHPLFPPGYGPELYHLAERWTPQMSLNPHESYIKSYRAWNAHVVFVCQFSVGYQRSIPEEDHDRPVSNWKGIHQGGKEKRAAKLFSKSHNVRYYKISSAPPSGFMAKTLL